MDYRFAVVVADVAMLHMQPRTAVAVGKIVAHTVDSIDDTHCNLVEPLLVSLKAAQMVVILVSLPLANHVADHPYLHVVAVVMPNFLNLLAHQVSFPATKLLRWTSAHA